MGRQSWPFQLVYFAICAWVAITIIGGVANSRKDKKKRQGEASAPPRPAAPRPTVAQQAGRSEGSVSTQGESAAEHAEHQKRVAAEEAARREAGERLRAEQDLRRDSLRRAIVMSEVLDRPVALRRRTGLHR